MNDYRRGLEKLGVIQNDQQAIDLRKNPAFAWRVLEAAYPRGDLWLGSRDTPTESLYYFVECIGAKP